MNILYEMFPEFNFNDTNHDKGGPPGLEELKIWVHIFHVCQYRFACMSCTQPISCTWVTCACTRVCRSCMPLCTWLCTLSKYFPSVALTYTTLKYVILVNIINNENLSCFFSSLTTGKVSGLTMLETAKLMEYGSCLLVFKV